MNLAGARNRSRRTLAIAVVVCLTLVLAACGGGSSDGAGSSDEPIKIGVIAPLSGSQPDRGKIIQVAAELAVEDINGDGGIDGRPLELVVVDDANDTNQAVTVAQRLIQRDGVVAISGIISSTSQEAIQPLAERSQVVVMGMIATATGLTDGMKFGFRATGSNDSIGPQIAELASSNGATKVAIVHDDTTYAQTLAEETITGFAETDAQVVAEEEYKVGTADMTPQIVNVERSGADAVAPFPITGADMALIARTLVENDVILPLFSHNGTFTTEAIELASKYYDQLPLVMGMGTIDLSRPEVAEFYGRMDEEAGFNVPQNEDAGQTYDAIQLIAQGLRGSGGEGGEALAEAIEGIENYVGMAGAEGSYYSFSAEKHTGLTGDYLAVYEYSDGQFEVVDD